MNEILRQLKEYEKEVLERIDILESLYEKESELEAQYRQIRIDILTSDRVVGLGNQTLRDAEFEAIISNDEAMSQVYKDYLRIKGKIRFESRMMDFYKELIKNRRMELNVS